MIRGFYQRYLCSLKNDDSFCKKSIFNYDISLGSEQLDLIKRMQSIYGTTNVGTSRILSKVHLSRLFRQPINNDKNDVSIARATVQGISE